MAIKSKLAYSKDDPEDYGHPSEDHTNRFSVDALLRKNGFKIHQRKGKRGTHLWLRCEILYTHDEAVLLVNRGQLADAEMAERLYLEGYYQ